MTMRERIVIRIVVTASCVIKTYSRVLRGRGAFAFGVKIVRLLKITHTQLSLESFVTRTSRTAQSCATSIIIISQDQSADLGMTYGQTTVDSGPVRGAMHPSQQLSMHQTQSGHPAQSASTVQQQRSFSSSEEERSTPECASDEPDESEKGK